MCFRCVRLACRAGRGPAGDRGTGRGTADVGRDRGRRPAAGRPGGAAAAGRARGVRRAGRRPARRPGGQVRADPRPVRHRRGGRAVRAGHRGGDDGAAAARGRGPRGRGRVPAAGSPTGAGGVEWCDAEVLRLLRRRCLARLRKEVEPVPPEVLARFLPAWHGIGGSGAGLGRRRADAGAVLEVVERLAGAPVPASALETLVLTGRVPGYSPPCSTSSPRRARSSGPARARCRAGTAGWCSHPPTVPRSCCPNPAR